MAKGVDWAELAKQALTKNDYVIIPTLTMTVDDTDYTIAGILTLDDTFTIPEGF